MAKLTKGKLFLPLLVLIFFALLFCLSGCGGSKDTTATTPTTPTTPETPTTPTTPTTPDLSSLTLSTGGINFVQFGTPLAVTATLTDGSGALVQGTVVTFAASSGLVVFSSADGTALTNSSGIAHISLNAADVSANGATSITASASVTTGGVTKTITSTPVGIAVGGALVTLGALTFPVGQPTITISAYATTSVSVPVFIDTGGGPVPATIPIQVAFTSDCANLIPAKATLTSPVTSNPSTGIATSTYKDNGCGTGTDHITAAVTGATVGATITVTPPAANNMQFISATPLSIGIKGSTLPQSSVVEFKVVDNTNTGVPGKLVDFTLLPDSIPGGVTLSALQATSDANGFVTVSVNSGTVPTPVWVVAKVHGSGTPGILSQSDKLTITTGLPTQNFFSLSVSTCNIEGWDRDGATSNLTIIASDRMGNPISNETVINFITPVSGQITGTCAMSGGACTVTYKSEGIRPDNGRVTILAYAVGEKSFIDTNGNNSYDLLPAPGETFYDLGDLYVDTNENGVWDPGEQSLSPPSGSGSSPCSIRPGTPPDGDPLTGDYDTVHHGNIPSKGGTCTGTWGNGINYVRRSAVITLSASSASSASFTISPSTTVSMGSQCYQTFDFTLTDENGNAMPVGTQVSVANNRVFFTPNGSTTDTAVDDVGIIYGTPVANTCGHGGTSFRLKVNGGSGCPGPATPAVHWPHGNMDIVVTSPLGVGIPTRITVNE